MFLYQEVFDLEENMQKPEVTDAFFNDLECPVCKEYLVAPIYLCVQGHSICNTCKVKLNCCPICQKSLSSGRNFTLEHMVDNMKFPCSNVAFGCREITLLTHKQQHEKICGLRLYNCLPGKQDGCGWRGRKWDIYKHIENAHRCYAWIKERKVSISWQDFDFITDFSECQIAAVYGELFWFQSYVDAVDETFYISVHYIGPHINCSQYYYKISCVSVKNTPHEILFSTATHADFDDIKDLQKECFCLRKSIGQYFVDDSSGEPSLTLSLEIIKRA